VFFISTIPVCLVPHDGMMFSYTSCFMAGDQHLTIAYVVPVRPSAFWGFFAFMALQKSSNEGGDSKIVDSSVCTVDALGVSVMAFQIVSVR